MAKTPGMLKVVVKALGTFERKTRAQKKKYEQNISRALLICAMLLKRESQLIVPVDTGFLRSSCFVRQVPGSRHPKDVIVGYTAYYALYVHEDLYARHAPGTQAKYLTDPYHRLQSDFQSIIAREAKKGL